MTLSLSKAIILIFIVLIALYGFFPVLLPMLLMSGATLLVIIGGVMTIEGLPNEEVNPGCKEKAQEK